MKRSASPSSDGAAEQRDDLLGRILEQLEVRADQFERGQQVACRPPRSASRKRVAPGEGRAAVDARRTGRRTARRARPGAPGCGPVPGEPNFLRAADGGDVAAQLLEAVVADGDAEVLAGDVLDFVRLVEHHGVVFGQDAAFVVLVLERQVGEEQVVVDDDDVALAAPAGASG